MIGVIDYGAGNTRSVTNALTNLGNAFVLSRDIETLDSCDKILFPGVGAAGAAMASLEQNNLDNWIRNCTKPFLGICLGFQLLFENSCENDTECLGIIPGSVVKFRPTKITPHMGWNFVEAAGAFEMHNDYFYFAHDYFVDVNEHSCATCIYDDESFSAVVRKDNFWAAQFHPEKSGKAGQDFLSLFLGHE